MSIHEDQVAELERALEEARRRRDWSEETARAVAAPLIRWYLDHSEPNKARRVWEDYGAKYELRDYLALALEISHGLLAAEEWDLANQVFWYSYEIAKRLDDGTLEVQTEALCCRAESFTGKGDYQSAWDSHFELQVLGIEAGDRRVQAISEMGMGDAAGLLGEWFDAADQYETAAGDFVVLGDLEHAAIALAMAAHARYLDDGDWDRSSRLLADAEEHCREREACTKVGERALALGELLEADESSHAAMRSFEVALRSFHKAENRDGAAKAKARLAMARVRLADEYFLKGATKEALRLVKVAHVELASLGDRRTDLTAPRIDAIKARC